MVSSGWDIGESCDGGAELSNKSVWLELLVCYLLFRCWSFPNGMLAFPGWKGYSSLGVDLNEYFLPATFIWSPLESPRLRLQSQHIWKII